MDTLSAFAMGQANRNKESMVFDWDKAAKIIIQNYHQYAEAGLQGDMEYTGGKIFEDGKPVSKDDTYTYLSSTWATPILLINGEEIPCYIMESKTDYDSETYWPESALNIINS